MSPHVPCGESRSRDWAVFVIRRTAKANITQAHPRLSSSTATSVPITHSADTGHAAHTYTPRSVVRMPLTAAQPQLGNRSTTAAPVRNSPPTRNRVAKTRVSPSAPASGFDAGIEDQAPEDRQEQVHNRALNDRAEGRRTRSACPSPDPDLGCWEASGEDEESGAPGVDGVEPGMEADSVATAKQSNVRYSWSGGAGSRWQKSGSSSTSQRKR